MASVPSHLASRRPHPAPMIAAGGLQALFANAMQGQTLAVAISTLLAAAAFQRVRGRVQRAVDQPCDRARYDGERTAAAFGQRIRTRVDPAGVEAEIDATMREGLHPASASVWVRRDSK